MRRVFRITCVLIAAALVLSFSAILAHLPSPPEGILDAQYGEWSGVLRLWAYEGCGLSGWLNDASARFERSHDGVYVQISYVSEETLKAFEYISDNPPDMILTCPGMLESAAGLIKTDISNGLRKELRGYGGGALTPVALGGYAWCINERRLPNGSLDGAMVLIREDEKYSCASAAFLGLLSGEPAVEEAQDSRYGVDLGLQSPDSAAEKVEYTGKRVEIAISADSRRDKDAYAAFARGDADCIVATDDDIRRLERLSATGRAPDWRIVTTGLAFTDRLKLMGIVESDKADANERQSMSIKFVEFLVSESRQAALSSTGAFGVIDGTAMYAGRSALSQLEAFLTDSEIYVPDAFDSGYKISAHMFAEEALQSSGGALEKFKALF